MQVQEVNRLLNQFEQMRGMMKKMKGGGLMKMMKRMGGMGGLGGCRADALPAVTSRSRTRCTAGMRRRTRGLRHREVLAIARRDRPADSVAVELPLPSLVVVGAVAAVALRCCCAAHRARRGPSSSAQARRADDLDTVAAGRPKATRVLTGGERAGLRDRCVSALPEYMILAQVPLARFIRVPTRHSYAEWLTRVGHLCADLVVCDRALAGASRGRGVAAGRRADSDRGARGATRMTRVLKARRHQRLTSGTKTRCRRAEVARDADRASAQAARRAAPHPRSARPDAADPGRRDTGRDPGARRAGDAADARRAARREPPPSTWFDDLDSGRAARRTHAAQAHTAALSAAALSRAAPARIRARLKVSRSSSFSPTPMK